MKKYVSYVIITVLCIAAIIMIYFNQETMSNKAITISQYYSVMEEFSHIDVPIYVINDDHLLTKKDAYASLYLKNSDASKKIQVTLKQITLDGMDTYLHDEYSKFMLEIDLPALYEDFYIEDCYLDITFINGTHLEFEIGMFSYLHIEDDVDDLFWTSLEAVKNVDCNIARMGKIKMTYEPMNKTIRDVSIGFNQPISFTVKDEELMMTIAYDDYVLLGCPIAIYFDDHTVQIIDYVSYIRENNMLKTSGLLIHIYDISDIESSD